MKARFVITLLALLWGPSLLAAGRPNILVLLVDDMGLMDSSVPFLTDGKGKPKSHPLNEFYQTPHLENLAGRGTRFEQFYANSVCSPTRVSIITGQSSARHHTTQWIRSENNNRGPQGPPKWKWKGITKGQQTLVGLLNGAGYRTIYAGKAHFGPFDAYGEYPDKFGFDVNIGGCSYGQPGSYYGKDGYGWIKGNKRRAVPHLDKYHGKDVYLTDALTIEMGEQIREAVKKDEPFLAYMAYYGVHAPFMANPRYAANYEDADVPKKAKDFATMIQSVDTSVGKLLGLLDELEVARDTFVVFLGDNGTDAPLGGVHEIACAAPLRGKKGTHYEGGMRVPFIAAWAKADAGNPAQKRLPITAGAITSEMGTIHDLFPTLLDLAQVDYKGEIDGDNLAPALKGGTLGDDREFLMHFPHSHRSSYYTAYRLGDWKLIYHYNRPQGERCEFFNLVKDPSESDNLAKKEPKELKRMFAAMTRALEEAGALYPVAKDNPEKELRPELP